MELISAIDAVIMLCNGAEITNRENATHFCSVKKDGQDFYLYLK